MFRIAEVLVLGTPFALHWRYLAGALAVFLLTMGFVVTWLTIQIGKGLRHPRAFRVAAILFGCSGAAQAIHAVFDSTKWPVWLGESMQVFILAALGILSAFMIASIPPLLEVLRASDEVRSLRGQAKFQAVVKAAPMAVVSADCQGRITAWNPAAEPIFGWKQQEIIGTLARTVPAARMEEQLQLLQRALRGEAITGFESERLRQNGERFPVSLSVAPLYEDDEGTIRGVIEVIEDISERRRTEHELHEKTSTLTAVTSALNQFLEEGDY